MEKAGRGMSRIEITFTAIIWVVVSAIGTLLWNSASQALHLPGLNYIVVLSIAIIFRLVLHLRGYDD